jgi:hypothetical protein
MVRALVLMGSGEEHSWHHGLLAIAERWGSAGPYNLAAGYVHRDQRGAWRSPPADAANRGRGRG